MKRTHLEQSYLFLASLCYPRDVKQLSRVVLHPTEQNDSNRVPFLLNYSQDIFSPQGLLPLKQS